MFNDVEITVIISTLFFTLLLTNGDISIQNKHNPMNVIMT